MMNVCYPSRFSQEVILQEASGRGPEHVSLVAPTITRPGEPFRIRLSLWDHHGLACVANEETVTIRSSCQAGRSVHVTFEKGRPAIAFIDDVVLSSPGFHRFEAKLEGRVFHSNPTWCTESEDDRIYWGDPHIHTLLSMCQAKHCRSLNCCYVAARDLSGLDWASAADHVSNGRGDLGKWRSQSAGADVYNEPGEFVTLPAYEVSLKSGSGGDHNVYMNRFPAMFVDEYEAGDVTTLCRKLRQETPDLDFFVVPHHTTRADKHGEIGDAIYPGPELMPVVEIHSKWGTSEYRGNAAPLLKVHSGPSYAVDFLDRGLRLGFIGGTDTHTTLTFSRGIDPGVGYTFAGLTAIRSSQLTREAVYQAIRNRHCYATSLERIYLNVQIAGLDMGQKGDWLRPREPRRIDISAAAQSDMTSIEIVRNGTVIHTRPGGTWHDTFDYSDRNDLDGVWLDSKYLGRFVYYYVRVTCSSGARAWSSPVWLCGDD